MRPFSLRSCDVFFSLLALRSCLALVCDWGRNKKWSREKSATSGAKVSNEKKEQKRLPKNHRHSSLWFQTHSLGIIFKHFTKSIWKDSLDFHFLKKAPCNYKSFISRLFGEFFDFYGRGCLQWDHASRYRRPDKHRPGTGTDQGPWIKSKSINHFNSNIKCQILLTVTSSSHKILTILRKFSISGSFPVKIHI